MLIEQIYHAGRVDGSHQYEHGEYPGDQRPPPEQGPDGQCHEEKQEVALKPFQGNMPEVVGGAGIFVSAFVHDANAAM